MQDSCIVTQRPREGELLRDHELIHIQRIVSKKLATDHHYQRLLQVHPIRKHNFALDRQKKNKTLMGREEQSRKA
jgi:hypothetical protein